MLDNILVTKLNAPRPDSVPRPRLVQLIEDEAARRLLLVSAPAGSGKTSALAEWVAHTSRSVAWLSLDAADTDLARFLAHVIAALRTLPRADHLGDAALAQLDTAQSPPVEAALASLINELAQREDQVALVLDDYHLIEAPAVHQALAGTVRSLHPPM